MILPDPPCQLRYDVIIIGGGAAGFFAAIEIAGQSQLRVLILEKSNELLQKVRISGGGRCNVTHDCPDAKRLSKHYPRGEKSLIGNFSRFGATDTIDWFASRGVELKTEADGRMFPTTDSSETIIRCLMQAARAAKVEICTEQEVKLLTPPSTSGDTYRLRTRQGYTLEAKHLIIATGGTRLPASARLLDQLDHQPLTPTPSLFTFKTNDPRITELAGISVAHTAISIPKIKMQSSGPSLITHWGFSGPGILRLSSLAARELAELDYQFQLHIDWLPKQSFADTLASIRQSSGRKIIFSRSPFSELPRRLWQSLVFAADIAQDSTWAQLTKAQAQALDTQLHNSVFHIQGKSLNKEEFVTCGGVPLKEIQIKTMSSKLHPRLYFAGEVIDVDGITGGFNFQNAWTSAHHAANAILAAE